MSTDVYVDFHSPEAWPFYRAFSMLEESTEDAREQAWQAWTDKLRMGKREHYVPARIGYLSNFVAECNISLWDRLNEECHGLFLTGETVEKIVTSYNEIYANSQNPANAEDCFMTDDIVGAEKMRSILNEHLGFWITFRTD